MRTSRDNPQSATEMAMTEKSRSENRLHKKADPTKIVRAVRSELADIPPKISLDNPAEVKKQVLKYLQICEMNGTVPSIQGMARSLGHSRQSIYKHMNTKPHSETSQFLEMLRDGVSEVLENIGLASANPAMSIFLLKSTHGYVDRAELLINSQHQPRNDPFGEPGQTEEELRAKYAHLAITDDY